MIKKDESIQNPSPSASESGLDSNVPQIKTLWMGNIPASVEIESLRYILASIQIFPSKIVIKQYENKLKYAFLEVNEDTYNKAIKFYSGKIINGFYFNFKKGLSFLEMEELKKDKKYTLFVGNVDKTISPREFREFFVSKFKSICRVKLIMENEKRSKGYGFVEFLSYKDYKYSLKKWKEVILGKQKLVFGKSRNRYLDSLDEENEEELKDCEEKNTDNNEKVNNFKGVNGGVYVKKEGVNSEIDCYFNEKLIKSTGNFQLNSEETSMYEKTRDKAYKKTEDFSDKENGLMIKGEKPRDFSSANLSGDIYCQDKSEGMRSGDETVKEITNDSLDENKAGDLCDNNNCIQQDNSQILEQMIYFSLKATQRICEENESLYMYFKNSPLYYYYIKFIK